MHISTLNKLDQIIRGDFCERAETYYLALLRRVEENANIDSILIDILIIYDAEAYFEEAWGESWQGLPRESVELYRSYGVDFEKFRQKHNLDVY
jgi:hypothetical protein